jgi:hypothetical protein
MPSQVLAEDSATWYLPVEQDRQQILADVEIAQDQILNARRMHADGRTQIDRWRLAKRWYSGSQKRPDSGVTLVWQDAANQLSVSEAGLRLTRRF